MTQDKELNKLDVLVLILLILSIGAYLGASYADNNWKHDLKQFSENNTHFNFDYDDYNSGNYYTIEHHVFNRTEYYKNKFINISNVKE